MAIHKYPDGACAISAQQVWRPGLYENEHAARVAQRLPDEHLRALQEDVNARVADPSERVIRIADLRDLQRHLQASAR